MFTVKLSNILGDKLRNEISLVNYSCVMNSVLLPFE